jgi:uncharacterized RDD family membrane protein YckC
MTKDGATQIVLASWTRRFIAWFADYLTIVLIFGYFQLETIETRTIPSVMLPKAPGSDLSLWSPLSILIFFLYFTFSEWYFGRSIGQFLLNTRLVDVEGKHASLKASAIQSIGKSNPLLLFFDCFIGLVYRASSERRQRILNMLSDTLVVFTGASDRVVRQGNYAKET